MRAGAVLMQVICVQVVSGRKQWQAAPSLPLGSPAS